METIQKEDALQQQYLTFFLAQDEYAVGIQRVKEIIEYTPVTTVPNMPEWIRGVINLRGNVVPVVDLAVRFGIEERPVTRTTCIVVVEVQQEAERTVMGVVADAVNQVIDLEPGEIAAPPDFGTRVRLEYLAGMGKREQKFALILNIDRALSTAELLTIAAVQTARADAQSEAESISEEQIEAT